MKITVIIPIHCEPEVAKLTIASFLKYHNGYDLDIHVGFHSNYHHYTGNTSLFNELKDIVSFHSVDEIDWLSDEYNSCWYRYSVMHCVNLHNLMKNIRYYDFDYLLILDHDLFFKDDFLTKFLDNGYDLISSLFDDLKKPRSVKTIYDGELIWSFPKLSVWHTLISRRLFDILIDDVSLLFPNVVRSQDRFEFLKYYDLDDRPVFFDTLAMFWHYVKANNVPYKIDVKNEFDNYVDHFFCSSFNYGSRTNSNYFEHIADIRKLYYKEFPNGIIV